MRAGETRNSLECLFNMKFIVLLGQMHGHFQQLAIVLSLICYITKQI